MDRDGYLVNQFTWKKVSSEDEQNIYKWLYENQERVGIVEHIDTTPEEPKQLEQKQDTQQSIANEEKVSNMLSNLTLKVKV